MDIVKNPIDYFKHPAISNSKLGWYKQSPAHYKYFQEHGTEDKPAYLIGSATHTVLFEPEKFDKTYHVLDESKRPVLLLPNGNRADFRNAENSKWRKDILDAYPHKIIITTEEYDMIMSMMQQLQKNSQAVELLQECEFEKEVYWIDPTTGLACKKKMDISGSAHRADYKTTDCADPYKEKHGVLIIIDRPDFTIWMSIKNSGLSHKRRLRLTVYLFINALMICLITAKMNQ